jgi:hypothetical protein
VQERNAAQKSWMIRGQKDKKHTTGGIPRWSPTLVLVARFSAYVWQSGRDAQFSLTYGRMCLDSTSTLYNPHATSTHSQSLLVRSEQAVGCSQQCGLCILAIILRHRRPTRGFQPRKTCKTYGFRLAWICSWLQCLLQPPGHLRRNRMTR